jgi:hypothetical protein
VLKTESPIQSFDPALLEKLTQPGVLGIFNHVEVTSVLATHKPSKRTANVFTHMVTLERTGLRSSPESLMPIKFSKLADWSFGITQHSVPLATLSAKLRDALMDEQWAEKKGTLMFGTLQYQGHWFAPPAGCLPDAPLNRLLKNNFWNGSHVFEWAPQDKSDFLPFFEKPQLLQALSEGIAEHLPIQLASVSDKLGSLILQIPVACLVSDYRGTGKVDGEVICDVNWHPHVTPRPLVITAERRHDGLLTHTSTQLSGGGQALLSVQYGPGGLKSVIRDQEHDVVLGTMEVNIIGSMHMGLHVENPVPRTFTVPPRGAGGASRKESVQVTRVQRSVTGNPNSLAHFDDTRKRIYREEMWVLRERREFVQYRPDDKGENGLGLDREQRHLRALEDIRYLIQHHGEKAVWLWDPYLDATDILNTLFHNQHAEAEMRALTGAEQINDTEEPNVPKQSLFARLLSCFARRFGRGSQAKSKLTKKEQFVITECNLLKQSVSDPGGLRLEFRAKVGNVGFAFHDRFLIFPHAEPEPLAWSLGISVNGLGKEHHILQKVPNGRLIADAFQELWDDLNQPEHVVWKAP